MAFCALLNRVAGPSGYFGRRCIRCSVVCLSLLLSGCPSGIGVGVVQAGETPNRIIHGFPPVGIGDLRVAIAQPADLSLELHLVALLGRDGDGLVGFEVGSLRATVHRLESVCVLVVVVVSASASLVLRIAWEGCPGAPDHDSLEQVLRVASNASLPVMHAMPRLSLVLGLSGGLHALILGDGGSVETACDMGCIRERFAMAESPLVEQVIRRCDVVMTVRLDAFDSVVWIKTKLVKYLLIYAVL